jgi:hypothetical protein
MWSALPSKKAELRLKDTLIEQDLGIDGIRESVLYVAGVGLPPASERI